MKINPIFAESFRFKGQVFTAQEAHDQALIAFSQANRIEKDMVSFSGLPLMYSRLSIIIVV